MQLQGFMSVDILAVYFVALLFGSEVAGSLVWTGIGRGALTLQCELFLHFHFKYSVLYVPQIKCFIPARVDTEAMKSARQTFQLET